MTPPRLPYRHPDPEPVISKCQMVLMILILPLLAICYLVVFPERFLHDWAEVFRLMFQRREAAKPKSAAKSDDLIGSRVEVLIGRYDGSAATCVGKGVDGKWAISPDDTDEVLLLEIDREFTVILGLPTSVEHPPIIGF